MPPAAAATADWLMPRGRGFTAGTAGAATAAGGETEQDRTCQQRSCCVRLIIAFPSIGRNLVVRWVRHPRLVRLIKNWFRPSLAGWPQPWRPRLLAPALPTPLGDLLDLVDRDSEDDHRAGDHLLPERRHPDDYQAIGQEADNEGADDRAAYRAATTGKRRAADDDSSDGIQLVERPKVSGRGADVGHLEDARRSPAQRPDKT